MAENKKSLFPKDFLWGASTASHQVEGGTYNQWSVWELENAQRLAKTAEERLSWVPAWERIKDEAKDPENYLSGRGVEHFTRNKEDLRLAKQLHLNSFRFGIEWSRVEPEEGQWDASAFNYYKQYIHEMKTLGLEPVFNLWHWTMPVWFTEKGGFEKRKNIRYFERFVQKVCQELPVKDLRYVITLNEPNVYASFGYLTGEWPPNQKSPVTFLKVYYNLALSHRRAYKILKRANPRMQIGVASQLANIQAKRPQNIADLIATRWMRYFWNWWFLNRIKRYQDFVGFNYYFTDYYQWGGQVDGKRNFSVKRMNPKEPLSDLGWYMEPEGLHALLVRVWAHYKKPIMVTENGLADSQDAHRRWWLEETIIAMERALSEGVEVIGYQHWSLLDNFEWAYGWWPRFGLIAVNRSTMKRTIRPSAEFYAQQIQKQSR
jgi:beta-glucosidase